MKIFAEKVLGTVGWLSAICPLSESDTQPAADRRPQLSGRSPVNPHVRILHRMRKSAEVGP